MTALHHEGGRVTGIEVGGADPGVLHAGAVVSAITPGLVVRAADPTAPEGLLKCIGCGQGKIPAMAGADPTPPGLDPTQLGLGHRIKRADHADQSCWREIQATGQCGI